jgi:hypothetical protein
MMKSQDILLLLKLVSLNRLEQRERTLNLEHEALHDWQGWQLPDDVIEPSQPLLKPKDRYSIRNLEALTGISKSEISASLKRSISVGLAVIDHTTQCPQVNHRALLEFITYGLKYVFPVEPGKITRGIPTSFAAPIMAGKLMTAGDVINVWPDPTGSEKGQSVQPLFKSVTKAVKQDPKLYKLLALIDAIRLGNARESRIAIELLAVELR